MFACITSIVQVNIHIPGSMDNDGQYMDLPKLPSSSFKGTYDFLKSR